jgi:ParB-like chromosome segregation protein Spo0J
MTVVSDVLPLAKIIRVSPLNARAKIPPDDEIAALASSIMATNGPAQPIVVRAIQPSGASQRPKADALLVDGHFEVLVGRRRWLALGVIADTCVARPAFLDELPVEIFDGEDVEAEAYSLQEQVHRRALTPPEEVKAFAALALQGYSEEKIAADFGQTVAVVRQRIRLGAAHEKILAAWADGSLNLECVKAFCGVPDKALQAKVFDEHPFARTNPRDIRAWLRGDQLHGDKPLARFVGEQAYVAAGGKVEGDLFAEDSWWSDPPLAQRLAEQKLEAEAARLHQAEGWKFVGCDHTSAAARDTYQPAEDATPKWLDREETEFDELGAIIEGRESTPGEIAAAERAREVLESKAWLRGLSAARRKKLAAWVDYGQLGEFVIDRGLEDIPAGHLAGGDGDGDGEDAGEGAPRASRKPIPIAPAVNAGAARFRLVSETRKDAWTSIVANNHRVFLAVVAASAFDHFSTFFDAVIDDKRARVIGDATMQAMAARDFEENLETLASLDPLVVDDIAMRAVAATFSTYRVGDPKPLLAIARDKFGVDIDAALRKAFNYADYIATLDKAELTALRDAIGGEEAAWPTKITELRDAVIRLARENGWLPAELRAPASPSPRARGEGRGEGPGEEPSLSDHSTHPEASPA